MRRKGLGISYKQETKNVARHKLLKRAIETLTINRSTACCVNRSYVRNLYDYFLTQEESNERKEAEKIDLSYVRTWENMHEITVGMKRAEELSVCYLAGPEPENDFSELVSLGVLPQNIWAFEYERSVYLQALQSVDTTDFAQPKLIKTSVERFFENTPKKFDIVYIDSCAPLISDQHALRCISTMFRYHRLESPGVLISNFAEIDPTNQNDCSEYYDLLAKYFCIKQHPEATLVNDGEIKYSKFYEEMYRDVAENFHLYYGEFITQMICNAGSITVPTLRFANSTYLQNITNAVPKSVQAYTIQDINNIKYNDLYKFFATNHFLKQNGSKDNGINRIEKLKKELSAGLERWDLLSCFQLLHSVRLDNESIEPSLNSILDFFESGQNMYQFLDRPSKILFFDSIINQLSYPMHYCADKIYRVSYVAKQTRMFSDLIVFDECRYIYDWLPAIHQIQNAFSNLSWQYVFRFALDGLVKQRLAYNNEFFFQGSVVRKDIDNFETQIMKQREYIN